MNAALNVMFTQIQASSGFNISGEIYLSSMVKELKKLDEGAMTVKKFIAAINTDLLSSSEKKSIWMR